MGPVVGAGLVGLSAGGAAGRSGTAATGGDVGADATGRSRPAGGSVPGGAAEGAGVGIEAVPVRRNGSGTGRRTQSRTPALTSTTAAPIHGQRRRCPGAGMARCTVLMVGTLVTRRSRSAFLSA